MKQKLLFFFSSVRTVGGTPPRRGVYRPGKLLGGGLLLLLAGFALPVCAQKNARAAADQAIKAFFGPKQTAKASAPTLLAHLSDARITESSGLICSRRTPGVLWTHNDSGDGPYLFAIDRHGRTLARFTVPNAKNNDWEDIAWGLDARGKPEIYVGDIGDNDRNRNDTAVYRLPEPAVDVHKFMQEKTTAPPEWFPYRYPDGHHDAETLLVDPRTKEVYVVAKEWSGITGVYVFPMPLTPGREITLKRVGTIRFAGRFLSGGLAKYEVLATGGDISPDGRKLVIRTYLMAYEWNIAPGQSVAEAIKGRPREIVLPLTRQGESICYRPDGKTMLMTSEGVHTPLYEIPARWPR
jgi:hypothetical protein